MPKGVYIQDPIIMEKFRETVQGILPFSLDVNKNLQKFSDLIANKTTDTLIVSTLRRIFQNRNVTTPSLFFTRCNIKNNWI